MENISVTRQNSEEIDKFLDGEASFPDIWFEFLEGSNESEENLRAFVDRDENANDEVHEDITQVEQKKSFWEAQQQLLQVNFVQTYTPRI